MQLVVSGFCRPVTRVRDSLQDADVQCAHITQSVVLRARIMNARDLQRYKQLLLTKLDELSAARAETASRVLGAGSPMGILAIKQTPTLKRSCTSRCIKVTVVSSVRLTTHWLESVRTGLACVRSASAQCPRRGSKLCLGRGFVGIARSTSKIDVLAPVLRQPAAPHEPTALKPTSTRSGVIVKRMLSESES